MQKTFEEFLEARGEDVSHFVFEAGMYQTEDKLSKIVKLLTEAHIAFEVIGGVAVNAHLGHPAFVTRDVDLLVNRPDLPRIIDAAKQDGYEAGRIAAGYCLLLPGQELRDGVHLIFAGERSRSEQPVPHPEVRPEQGGFLGVLMPVSPLADLVAMKLSAFRIKDKLHLQMLDEAGLIATVETMLPLVLRERLAEARKEFAQEDAE